MSIKTHDKVTKFKPIACMCTDMSLCKTICCLNCALHGSLAHNAVVSVSYIKNITKPGLVHI